MKISHLSRPFKPLALVAALIAGGLVVATAVAPAALAQNQPSSAAPAANPAPTEIDPAQLALARKYVDLTNKGQLFEVILVETAQKTSKLFVPQNPDQAKKINDVIGQVLGTYKGKNDDLFNQIARIYAVSFTPDELQQIVDFYSSPAGQKLAGSAAAINGDVQKVMKVYTYNFGTEFVTKVRSELKAAGINP